MTTFLFRMSTYKECTCKGSEDGYGRGACLRSCVQQKRAEPMSLRRDSKVKYPNGKMALVDQLKQHTYPQSDPCDIAAARIASRHALLLAAWEPKGGRWTPKMRVQQARDG